MKTKLNDYYYKVKTITKVEPNWLSWREVCELRRQTDVEIVEKITKEDYHRMMDNDRHTI